MQSEWHRTPSSTLESGVKVELSKAARLIGEWVYDVSLQRDALYCFEVLPGGRAGKDKLSDPIKIASSGPIMSYDVDRDEGVLVLLADGKAGIQLTVHNHTQPAMDILQQGVVFERQPHIKFAEVSINRSSIMVSLENDVRVFDWKKGNTIREIWSRSSEELTWDGLYIRGHLLSSEVVACTVLSTYRTIGSMRVRHGVVELYRLDQHFPIVAEITLPEALIDVMQPRIMQDPYQYIAFDLGGKGTLDLYQRDGVDGPAVLQIFSDTVSETMLCPWKKQESNCSRIGPHQRLGSLSTLCDILYPKAALALYSFDPSKPTHPILGGEWLRSNFPILRSASPLQSSVHGHRMISTAKQGRNELIYWSFTARDYSAESLQGELPACTKD